MNQLTLNTRPVVESRYPRRLALEHRPVTPDLKPLLAKAEALFCKPPPMPPAPPANSNETPHQKVFELVGEGRFEDAATLAKRLIDAGDVEGFFIYGSNVSYRNVEANIAGRVKASLKGAFSDIIQITPEIAQAIVRNNPNNRKIVAKGLAHRLRDIVGGRWELNGQPIIIAKTGDLNDGQHRLWAVILSGARVRSNVFFGAERDTRLTIDINNPRPPATRLGFLDVPYASLAAAAVTLIHKIENGRDATASEKVSIYVKNESDIQSAIKTVGSQPKGTTRSALVASAYLLAKAGAPQGLLDVFFTEIRGAGKPTSQKVKSIKLREAILAGTFRGTAEHLTYTVISIYGEWRRGKKGGDVEIITSMPELVTF